MEMEKTTVPAAVPATRPGTVATNGTPKLLNMKETDLLSGGLSLGAVVGPEFASAWEPMAWRQWMARDKTIKAKVASSENYTQDHLNGALEAAIPKRYLDEHCGKGKHNTDVKVAVAWFPDGDAAKIAVEVIAGTTTVSTHSRNSIRCRRGNGSSSPDSRVEHKVAVVNIAAQCSRHTMAHNDERALRGGRRAAGAGGSAARAGRQVTGSRQCNRHRAEQATKGTV